MNDRRGFWYLLTGVIIGVVIGVGIAWAPIHPVELSPANLRPDFKDEYRYMIASAYVINGNIGRARARLELLKDPNPVQALDEQSQRMLANNTAPDVVRSVSNLSRALQENPAPQTQATPIPPQPTSITAGGSAGSVVPTPTQAVAPTVAVPTETLAPDSPSEEPTLPPAFVNTIAPPPTVVPTATSGTSFNVTNQATFCEADRPGLLRIRLEDASGQPVAGVELVITWANGEERFFTGLKPEMGNGYADFVMSADIEYALSIGGTRVTALSTPACTNEDGSSYPGGVALDFRQP